MIYQVNRLRFWYYLQGGFLYRIHCARLRKAIKILISVVVGALLLAGLYTLFKDTVLPTLTSKIQNLFDYNG